MSINRDVLPGGPSVDDGAWAPMARATREALALLGHRIDPKCLPDEPDPCGGTFAMHTMAHLAWLEAIADHELWHLGPEFKRASRDVYWRALGELDDQCLGPATPETPGNPG